MPDEPNYKTYATRVGTLFDGVGSYLDGDNPHLNTVEWQTDPKQRFQAFLNATPEAEARNNMVQSDRLYIMPPEFNDHGSLPAWILAKIAMNLKQGGKVMILAPDEAAFHKLANWLTRMNEIYLLGAPSKGTA